MSCGAAHERSVAMPLACCVMAISVDHEGLCSSAAGFRKHRRRWCCRPAARLPPSARLPCCASGFCRGQLSAGQRRVAFDSLGMYQQLQGAEHDPRGAEAWAAARRFAAAVSAILAADGIRCAVALVLCPCPCQLVYFYAAVIRLWAMLACMLACMAVAQPAELTPSHALPHRPTFLLPQGR